LPQKCIRVVSIHTDNPAQMNINIDLPIGKLINLKQNLKQEK